MNPSITCPTREQLIEMTSGTASAMQTAELEQHLLECAACNSVIAEAMENDPLAQMALEAGWPPVPVDAETEQLTRRIAAAVETRLNAAMETCVSSPVRRDTELDLSWLEPSDSPDELGRLGNFVALRLLGRGGMGAVFEAEDTRLRRRVALKVMLPGLTPDKAMKERFLREARSAAAVHHRHVVTIFEVGEAGTVPYLAMELLRGESLEDRLKREGRLAPGDAANIAAQVAEGLSAAHRQGVLHRDIKPGNIWLEFSDRNERDEPENVKLLDFGLAKPMGTGDGLTQSGVLVGTLKFLSPEQACGGTLDGRSDLFSLGCMLYHMLSGRYPFEGTDTLSQLNALANKKPIAIKDRIPEVPNSLALLIQRLLAKNVDERPATANDVAAELWRITKEREDDESTQSLELAKTSLVASDDGGSKTRRRIGIFSAGFVPLLVLLGIIVITIKHRDGTKTEIQIDVRSDAKASDSELSSPDRPAKTDLVSSNPLEGTLPPAISLDHLDPSAIPESEKFDWQPEELVAVIGEHRLRHWSRVMQVRFHPSGQFFITVPDTGPGSLWMTDTLKQRKDAPADDAVEAVSFDGFQFSQDGKWLSSANQIYSVDMTDAERPQIKLAQTLTSDDNRFGRSDVAIYDSRWLIMGAETPGELMLWDLSVEPGRLIKTIRFDATGVINRQSWSADGRLLAVSVGDGAVRVWDVDWTSVTNPEFTLRDQQVPVIVAVMSPQGPVMATGGEGHEKIELWDVSQTPFELLNQIQGGREFTFSPDGKHLAVAAGLGVQLYAHENAEWVRRHHLSEGMAAVIALAWSPDQTTLVAGDQFGGIHVWDTSVDLPKSRVSNLPGNNVRGLTFAPNGKSMIVMGSDNQAARWNLDAPIPSRVEWSTYCDPGHLPSYSFDSKLVRVHDHVWDLATEPPSSISDTVSVLARFVPVGTGFVSLDSTTLSQSHWELTKRGRFITGREHELWKSALPIITNDAIETLQFEAQRFATRFDEQTVCVWGLSTSEKPLFELKHNLKFGNSSRPLTLSPDGTVLLAFSQQESIVWDLEESPPREYRLQLDAHLQNAFFTSDNKQLVVADSHGVGIYDWAADREVRRLKYPGAVRQVILHPDGSHLATVNGNGTVYILRMPDLLKR